MYWSSFRKVVFLNSYLKVRLLAFLERVCVQLTLVMTNVYVLRATSEKIAEFSCTNFKIQIEENNT